MNKQKLKDKKAIALFSGGLDSIVAVKWMQHCGYTVYPVYFKTPYMPAERAMQSSIQNDIDLIVRDISKEHLSMMQKPRFGFGKNMNPCIDCHALMFKIAGELLMELDADYLISGEVLGQRPMSQRRDAINLVGKLSGFRDLLIRPLSQKLLSDTIPIRESWIDPDDMLDISGRSRARQIELARSLGISEYPHPAGGCLLTDRNYTLRLKDLFDHSQINRDDIEMLKYGRHFRISETMKLIVGRDQNDNENLEQHAMSCVRLKAVDIAGPLGIISSLVSPNRPDSLSLGIFWHYHTKAPNGGVVEVQYPNGLTESVHVEKAPIEIVNKHRLSYD